MAAVSEIQCLCPYCPNTIMTFDSGFYSQFQWSKGRRDWELENEAKFNATTILTVGRLCGKRSIHHFPKDFGGSKYGPCQMVSPVLKSLICLYKTFNYVQFQSNNTFRLSVWFVDEGSHLLSKHFTLSNSPQSAFQPC